jgi:hypothetical protein
MKLKDRLLQMLSRGDGSTSPDEELELAVVPIAAGPMKAAPAFSVSYTDVDGNRWWRDDQGALLRLDEPPKGRRIPRLP